jgi:hypothetical protein
VDAVLRRPPADAGSAAPMCGGRPREGLNGGRGVSRAA